MKKLLSEKNSIGLLIIGFVLLAVGLTLFLWKNYQIDTTQEVNASKAGQLGDFIGGIVGSIWALAGVILFYVALTEQRKDFSTNKEVLVAQLKALNYQIEEFKLQRQDIKLQTEEMKENRLANEQQAVAQKEQVEATLYAAKISAHSTLINAESALYQAAIAQSSVESIDLRKKIIWLTDTLKEIMKD